MQASKARVLTLFCCQGGSARGYANAGMEIVGGVDMDTQPRFPYPFIQGDALQFLKDNVDWIRRCVDLVDSSPPCQGYSDTQRINGREWPMLIPQTRELLEWIGLPFIIENVVGARDEMSDPVELCGTMFGLHTYRHRLIETGGFTITAPEHPEHPEKSVKMGRALQEGDFYHAVGNFSGVRYAARDMGVEWMSRDGIRECVPPAYTEYIARQFLAQR